MLQFSNEVAAPLSKQHILSAVGPVLENPDLGDVWVVESQNLLGYLVLSWGWGIESGGKEALIDELFVLPEYRGQGLATAMLEVAVDRAFELGTKAIFLETEADNPQSRSLYTRLGFQTESSIWMRLGVDGQRPSNL